MDTTLTYEDVKWALNWIELARKEKNEKLLAKFTAPSTATFVTKEVRMQFWIQLLKQPRYFDGLTPTQLIDCLGGNAELAVFLISLAYSNSATLSENKQQTHKKRKRQSEEDNKSNEDGPARNKSRKSNKKKKTHEQFVAQVEALRPGEYEVLDTYIDAKTRIRFCHIKCGSIFPQTPDGHLRGYGCKKCGIETRANARRKTHEAFSAEVESLHPGEYEIMDKYVNDSTAIRFRHIKCGSIIPQLPTNHLQNHGCKHCAIESRAAKQRKTHQQFIIDSEIIHDGEYIILDTYVNNHTPVRIRHVACGSVFPQNPKDHLQGRGCQKCNNKARTDKRRKTHAQFVAEVEALRPGEYTVLEAYVSGGVSIQLRHNLCGFEFPQSPNNHLRGKGCPNCRWKSEQCARKIAEDLIKEKFPKKRPNWLGGLELDCYNQQRKRGIEYNGEQHVKFIPYFHDDEEDFKAQQERDARKRRLCAENGVALLEIPHTYTHREPKKMEAFIRKWFEDLGDIPRQQTTLNFESSDSS